MGEACPFALFMLGPPNKKGALYVVTSSTGLPAKL